MRLRKMEQVPCEDTELVLAVLVDRLRMLTHDVVREGERITMFGLGPSPRAINPRDTTVIDVRASDGVTTIDADVSFQASAFLADMPQDTIVLGKLERVFEEMKAEIDFKAHRPQLKAASMPVMVVPIPEAVPVIEEAPAAEAHDVTKVAAPTVEAELKIPDSAEAELNPAKEIFVEIPQEPEITGVAEPVVEETPVAETRDVPETAASAYAELRVPESVEEEPGPVKEIFVEIPREPEITSVAEPVVEETPVAETLDVPEMAASADAELKVAESVEEEPSPSKSIFLEMQQEPEKASVADPEIESFAEPRIQEAHAAETKEVVAVASTRDEVLRVPASVEEGPGPSKSIFLEVHPIKVVASQHSAVKNRRLPIEIRAFDKIFAAAEEELKKTARGRLVITVATLTVMAIAGARYIAGRQGGAVPEGEQAPVALSSPPTLISVAAKPVAASATPPPAPAPPAAAPDPTASEDPAEVVKQWETALRTRDAAAQAAFYADPVDRYFLRHNLSKDAVVADKQAAIDKRKGGWTVKMDRVKVQRKGDDVADVSLVKHYMEQQDGATTSEWFVPSRLQLKRADGKWRIVSERDLGWATSLDDLDG